MAITLSERVTAFLNELSISKTAFCPNVKLSVSSLWRWQHGELELSDATLDRIDSYLKNIISKEVRKHDRLHFD